jgi:hypothetical protein
LNGEDSVLLVYAPEQRPLDYSQRLARLRWRRALCADPAISPAADTFARDVLQPSGVAVVVRDACSIPLAVPCPLEFFSGRIVPAWPVGSEMTPPPASLRMLEALDWPTDGPKEWRNPPAVGFDARLLPPEAGELLASFVERLFTKAREATWDPGFRALRLEDSASRELEDLRQLLPRSAKRVCEAVNLGTDPMAALEQLAGGKETFDAFLFAGLLERLDDPVRALRLARQVASPGAMLIVSVPNVVSALLARDLLEGRFDPMPSGLFDGRHVRWFDRTFFTEALEEAGWTVARRADRAEGARAEDESFLSAIADWPGLDAASLNTRSWVAIAYPK